MAQTRDLAAGADAADKTPAEPGNPALYEWAHARQRVLTAAFSHARRVLVLGDADATNRLVRTSPELFFAPEDGRDEALGAADTTEILALSLDPTLLARGTALVRQLGCAGFFLLLPNVPSQRDPQASCSAVEEVRPHLKKLGYVAVDFQRIFWAGPDTDSSEVITSRTERLDRETREVLIECLRLEDPTTAALLEERLVKQRHQIDLLSDIQVQQARVRESEKQRIARCSELEETVRAMEKVRSAQARALLVAESEEIQNLRTGLAQANRELAQSRGEIAVMSSTRVWRLGLQYWRIRSWLSGALRGRER